MVEQQELVIQTEVSARGPPIRSIIPPRKDAKIEQHGNRKSHAQLKLKKRGSVMKVLNILGMAVMALFLSVGSASAFLHAGSADVGLADMTSGGEPPTILNIEGLSDIEDYAFDGSDLEIDFTLDGAGATVWLIIYTTGQNPPLTIEGEGPPPYQDAERGDSGWHVYDGVDYLVFKSEGQRFEEGSNTIVWNGRDMHGNVVEAGEYHLHLAAYDDEATPHLVGPVKRTTGAYRFVAIDPSRDLLYGALYKATMTDDWIEHDWAAQTESLDAFDFTTLSDACGDRCGGDAFGTINLLSGNDWIGNIQSGTGFMLRGSIDWDSNQLIVDEDWGLDAGAENGIIENSMPGRSYGSYLNPDKTILLTTGGVSGTQSSMVGWSVETGERLFEWDQSDLWLYDNNGSDRSSGPGWVAKQYNGEPDPFGIAATSHHTSLITRHDWDGNLKWVNRNGDGFGDQKPWSAEAGFVDLVYGHTEAPNFKYSIYVTDWGWVSLPANGLDNVNFGYVLGQDGSGLFNFQPKQAPLTWPQFTIIVNDDTNWDGVYMAVGGIQDEAATNDWLPADTPFPNTYPIAYWPYDQKSVNLGMGTTAVIEQEGNTPDAYELGNAYPNPFNPETTIRFSLPWSVDVKVDVFNDQGQLVRTLVDETLNAGQFEVTWDGKNDAGHQVASGVYIYKINAPNLSLSKKVTFLK